jgi:glycosyltransferase involved in cell wall biosynthesis
MSKLILSGYKTLNKISPFLGQIAAGWYSTINGWRFEDLKKFFISKVSIASNPCLLARMRTLDCIESDAGLMRRVAFVSPMPPEDTGIASCTFYSFRCATEEIDLFCQPSSDDAFLSMARRLGSNSVRLLDVNLLTYADDILNYKKIVFALGNSHHHYYLWSVFNRVEFFGVISKCVIYAHDPFLNNFIQSGLGLSDREYVNMISEAYGLADDIVAILMRAGEKWRLHAELYELGITGVRLLTRKGFRKFLVNSERAKIILENDIGEQNAEVYKIFHPLFEPTAFSAKSSLPQEVSALSVNRKNLVLVGTFGVPGNSKGTHLVIDAVRKLHAGGVNIRLVVAGFGVTEYFKKAAINDDDFLIKIDSPSDGSLYALMSEVDIAVQLRLNDAGESSGIVPQLLMAKKRVVVSPVGSFKEYGDLVEFLNDPNPSKLSELIQKFLLRLPNVLGMEGYCQMRTPTEYRRLLLEYCGHDQIA